MSTAELILDPYFLFNGERYYELKLNDEKLDILINKRIEDDYIDIKSLFNHEDHNYIVLSYIYVLTIF